nr:hypothetical protein BaRGS_019563 [Batillaria attramentaria]
MGHVSLEFLKRKDGQERVAEVFVVSGDGVQVYVEQWQAGCPPSSDAALEQAWHTFTYHDLPEKYWKKYAHAYRFVDLVKSKTPKVTMYTDHAKGVLMENWPPSFEVTFYHAGPTIVMTGNDVHIREDNGASLVFSKDCLNNLVSDYTLGLIRHATQTAVHKHLFVHVIDFRESGSLPLSCSSPHFCRVLSASSPDPHGHHASPPASPVPILDLRYVQSDGISEVVRLKLEKLPMVLDCLMTRPAAPPYGMASS